jgi:hypothetical protein
MLPDTPQAGRRRRPRRFRRGVGWLLLLAVVLLFILQIGLSPWVLHIGGTFTPTMSWSGYGTVTGSNGGRYVLYTDFQAGYLLATKEFRGSACSRFGCDNLRGTAKLCTLSGTTETFALTGAVHSWLQTEGARTGLSITGGKPKPLPDRWLVAMRGTWHGPALTLASPDNSFTEVFTPRGAIRTVTSTADAGTATVTLRPGSAGAFSQACRTLAGRG